MSRANPSTTHDNAGIAAWRFKMLGEIHSYEGCARVMAEHGADGFAKIGPHMTLIHEGHPLDDQPECPECGEHLANTGDATYRWTCNTEGCDQKGTHFVADDFGYINTRTYAVELYTTKIIRYYPDGTFSVDNGGRATPTTMYRLCAVLPPAYSAYHHRKQLGLRADSLRVTFPPISRAAARDGARVLWPLDHSKRITIDTGEIVS